MTETTQRSDNQSPENFGQTPSQTVGPYFHFSLPWRGGADLVGDLPIGARTEMFEPEHYVLREPQAKGPIKGQVIELVGHVYDGDHQPMPDCMLEIWQANSVGRYASADDERTDLPLDESFVGWGRAATSKDGDYRFRTIKPGRVPGPGNSLQAPHIALSVFGRGMLKRLTTRIYFEDQPGENAEDTILGLVPEGRRATLLARKEGENTYRLDIVLQGEGETVFFDV